MKRLKKSFFESSDSKTLKKFCGMLKLESTGPNSILIERLCSFDLSVESQKILTKAFGPSISQYMESDVTEPIRVEKIAKTPTVAPKASKPAAKVEQTVTAVKLTAKPSTASKPALPSVSPDTVLARKDSIVSALGAYGAYNEVDDAFLSANADLVAKALL